MVGVDAARDVTEMLLKEYDPKYVRLCNVEWFNNQFDPTCITVGELKQLSVKVVEEAAEAMEAGKECIVECDKQRLREELADVIQACCNLAAAFGVFDLRKDIDDCRDRNTDRGRISKKLTDRQMQVMKELKELQICSDSWFTEPDDGV